MEELNEWQKDENGHWKTYSCCLTVKSAKGTHDFGEDGKCECGAVLYNITFNPNGGAVDPTSATTDINGKLTELPTPTCDDDSYRFDGWFTESGKMVTTDTIFDADTTIYAYWQIMSNSPLYTWQEWEIIEKIVEANKKKDEPMEVEPEPEEVEPTIEPWENPFADVAETDALSSHTKTAT